MLVGASPHYVGGLMQNAPLLALFAHEGYEDMVALLLGKILLSKKNRYRFQMSHTDSSWRSFF